TGTGRPTTRPRARGRAAARAVRGVPRGRARTTGAGRRGGVRGRTPAAAAARLEDCETTGMAESDRGSGSGGVYAPAQPNVTCCRRCRSSRVPRPRLSPPLHAVDRLVHVAEPPSVGHAPPGDD